MKPKHFDRVNRLLHPPPGQEEFVDAMPVHVTTLEKQGPVCISRWHLTPKERHQIAEGADVWLYVYGDHTQPPVAMLVSDNIFPEEDQENDHGS